MKWHAAAGSLALMAPCSPLSGAVLTVGPAGAYATVQAAIDVAVASPEDDELRLRATTFFEQIEISASDLGGKLEISGGWDAAFAVRDPDPATTVLDGSSTGRVFYASAVDTGKLVLRGLTFQNGLADASLASGGGLYLVVTDAAAEIEDCVFDANLATTTNGSGGASSGGAAIFGYGSAQIELVGVSFTNNEVRIDDTIGAPIGGGFRLYAGDTTQILLRHGLASGNQLNGGSQRRGAAFLATAANSSTIEIEDVEIYDNHGNTVDAGSVTAHGFELVVNDSATLTMRRATVTDNWNGAGDFTPQIRLRPSGSGTVSLTDSLVARGGYGIELESDAGVAYLNNLTVTEHELNGARLSLSAPGAATVTNSICWDNPGGDLVLLGATATEASNLVNVDPLFIDAPGGDYRLAALSVAIDAGTASPAGGLGPFDLAHAPRTSGSLPDQGAYERESIFGDGFERGDFRPWSASTP